MTSCAQPVSTVTSIRGGSALVTGGGNGIGAASARLLAQRGAHVVVADVDRDAGQIVAEEIGGTFSPLDVSDAASWAQIPCVDFAFLNAGVISQATACSIGDISADAWSRIRGVNIDGVVGGLLHLLPAMIASGGGSILLAASLAGLVSFPPDPLYAASKALVISLARSVGALATGSNVRINALCPGEVATRMLPTDRAAMLARRGYLPLSPEDVARAAVEVLECPEGGIVWTIVGGRPKEKFVFPDVPRPVRSVAPLS
jgi:NADP-dependent 3-hydroxy acid dehydrogenase YdfG